MARPKRLRRRRAMMPCAGRANARTSAAAAAALAAAAPRCACAAGDTRCKMAVESHRGDPPMLFLLTSRTRAGLGAEQFAQLAALAKSFYASIPAEVAIRGEWAAIDRSANYSLLE